MSRACTDWAVGWISALGERRRTADAVAALRAGQRDGYDALGKELLGWLRSNRREMRDIDDGGNCCHRKRTRRIEMAAVVMRAGVVVEALNDRRLVRAKAQLQAIGLRRQEHETDRQKGARYQQWQQPTSPFPEEPAVHEGVEYRRITLKDQLPLRSRQATQDFRTGIAVAGFITASASTSLSVLSSPSHLETTTVAILFPMTLVAERPISRK
jgi:hypothetical protein